MPAGIRLGADSPQHHAPLSSATTRRSAPPPRAAQLRHHAPARRRPAPDREPVLAAPGSWEEFTSSELCYGLAESRWAAEAMLDLAHTLAVKLPGTYAAFRAGVLRESKAAVIARAVMHLTPAEARRAEAKVLDRAGKLTPAGLARAIKLAVLAIAPDKAVQRREAAARQARVERWLEESGNAGLTGRDSRPRPRTGTPRHPEPRPPASDSPPGPPDGTLLPSFTFTAAGQPGPPGGYGTWRLTTGLPGQPALLIVVDRVALDACDHRFQAAGHDPGVKLRHLAQIWLATCTAPTCRRPARQCDFEHNILYENGGPTCLCNGRPQCQR